MAKSIEATEVAVIGAGPGGYAAAFMAADEGLDVTLIDPDPNPGGTCLYRGCIPSKALLHAAKILTDAREAQYWGIEFAEPKIDFDGLRKSTDEVVQKMTGGLGQLCKARKIRYLRGRAGFMGPTLVRVHEENGNEYDLKFRYAVLATGSRPATLGDLAPDFPHMMNSTDALKTESVPKTLLVIGGGYIGLELGTVYAALGSKVTVVEMTPALLPGVDPDLVKPVASRMESICEAIHLKTKVSAIETARGGLRVTFDGQNLNHPRQVFEKVLVSVGRKPNSSGLGLHTTKVEVNGQGFVVVDEQRRTADLHIFAIGDLVGQPMLAHKATHEGIVAAEVIAGHNVVFDPRAIPAVVFTDPEVAWCGMSEAEARNSGREFNVGRFAWGASGRATTLHRNDGLTKVIADAETAEVLGVGIVGSGAGELIAEGVLAMEMGASARDLQLTIHPHPTLSETIMEAGELIYGRSTHLYRPQRRAKAPAEQPA